MNGTKRPKRPCDRCRMKKRKCDGQLPCSTCVKCRTGDAICKYTNAPFTRTPREDKDGSFVKLKYLESVLNSIVSNTTSYGDAPAATQLSGLIEGTTLENTPFDIDKEFGFEPIQDNFWDQGLTHNLFSNGDVPMLSNFSTPGYIKLIIESLDILDSMELGGLASPFDNFGQPMLFSGDPHQIMIKSDKPLTVEDAEMHLLDLSFMYYCGHCSKPNLSSAIPLFRESTLSNHLRNAINYHSIFMTNHPLIFETPPSFEERLKAAEKYQIYTSHEGFLSKIDRSNNQEVCDGIRALLIHAISQFSIGNAVGSIDLLSKAAGYLRHFGILNKKSLEDDSKASKTLDDYVALDFRPSLQLSDKERAERVALLAMILGIDTYGSMTTGNGFFIDESDFPESVFPSLPLVIDSKKMGRFFNPTLGRHSCWENTEFSALFDEIKELSLLINENQPSLALTSQFQLLLLKLIRKILRFSRAQKYIKGGEESRFTQVILHNSLLQFLMMAPSTILIFRSLSGFAYGVQTRANKEYSTRGQDSLSHSLVFISAFAYLHFTSAVSTKSTKFALEIGGPCIYSSRDVLYSLVNCLTQIIITSEKPFKPSDSFFGKYDYHPEDIKNCSISNMPSPLFCQALNSMMSFVVSSSALVAFKSPDTDQAQAKSVFEMVKNTVLPAMRRIDTLWPGSSNFTMKLQKIVNEF